MQKRGLHKSLLRTVEQPNEYASLANGASNDEKKNHKVLKDVHEKKVVDIKEKQKCVVPSGSTPDTTTLMLVRHDSVGDEDIGDGAKDWRHESV